MKLNEIFTVQKGIFGGIFAPNFPDQFNAIFGSIGAITCDVYTLMNWGEKTVINYLTPETADDVVNAVIAVNVGQWVKQAEAMTADYNLLNPTTRTVEHSEDVKTDENANDETMNSEKAFNDETFTDGERQTAINEKTRKETRNYTETVSGLGENKNFSESIEKELRLRRDNWIKSVIFALVKEITTDIY